MTYHCILRSDERADSEALYSEFSEVCLADLTSALPGQTAWSGVRAFDFIGTDRLDELPVLSRLLDRLGRENVVMVNYYNLAPHSSQHEHRDQQGNLLFGISRIHVPLKTNPGAVLRIERKDYHLPVGELWAIDTSGLHAAVNTGDEGRVHLVIDVKRAPATAIFFPEMTFAVRVHLVKFVLIMGWKVVRDSVTKPSAVIDRLGYVAKRLISTVMPRSAS